MNEEVKLTDLGDAIVETQDDVIKLRQDNPAGELGYF